MNHVEIGTRDIDGCTQPLDNRVQALKMLSAVQDSRKISVKLYRLVVITDMKRYNLSTTSKDVFLSLGSFGLHGQKAFVELVNEEVPVSGDLLITFPHEDGCKGFLCVIRATNLYTREIMISPASDK